MLHQPDISRVNDISFKRSLTELISRDKINVSYIINLLRDMRDKRPEDQAKARKTIMDVLDTEAQLRRKKELIERFISEHFANLAPSADVGDEFDAYWDTQKRQAMEALRQDEGLEPAGLDKVMEQYQFTGKTPMRDDFIGIMETRPSLRERRSVADRVIDKIRTFVETFVNGVD